MNRRTVVTATVTATMLTTAATVRQDILRCNAACGYGSFTEATADGLNTTDGPCRAIVNVATDGFRFTFRSHNHTDWRLSLVSTQGDTVRISVKGAEIADVISSQRGLKITATYALEIYDTVLLSEISASGGTNAWQLIHNDGTLTISGGKSDYVSRLALPLSADFIPTQIIFDTDNKTKGALITDILLMPVTSSRPPIRDMAQLQNQLLQSTQRYEGYWQMFDSEFDEDLLRSGGDYRLILVAENDGYDMVYSDGARINPGFWQPGMIKGRLEGTPFEGIYNVIWYDAEGHLMDYGLKAQFESDNTLSIQFPYQSSRIRLQRCPMQR
ncbi:MAG: hypothetical protein HDS13_08235 [Bacteroides sp.]|nr:hypothetical protein [Bacteroides sp.]